MRNPGARHRFGVFFGRILAVTRSRAFRLSGLLVSPAARAYGLRAGAASLSPPKFVRKLVVEPGFRSHDVAVRVFLKDGAVENETGEEQYIYINGDATRGANTKVRWG
jgi:hypothetical protein